MQRADPADGRAVENDTCRSSGAQCRVRRRGEAKLTRASGAPQQRFEVALNVEEVDVRRLTLPVLRRPGSDGKARYDGGLADAGADGLELLADLEQLEASALMAQVLARGGDQTRPERGAQDGHVAR